MNKLKKTLALVAAMGLAMTAFVGCGSSSDEEEATTAEQTTAAVAEDTTAAEDNGSSADAGSAAGSASGTAAGETGDSSSWTADQSSLKDDGDKFTIITWTTADLDNMFKAYDEAGDKNTTGIKPEYQLVGSSGTEAMEQYSTYFDGGNDVDLYCAEAGWILSYITDSKYAAPLSEIGLYSNDYSDAYQYTLDVATNDGELMGATWQAAPGGFVYRTDLAKDYLGIENPDDMQSAISDWDKFWDTAKTVYEKSGKKCKMADTAGGVWQAYSTAMNKTWVKDGNVLDTDGCEDYVNMINDAYNNHYIDETQQWTDAWFAEGQDDSTFGYFFSTWCLTSGAQLEQASGGTSGATYGKYNIVTGPCNYFWGGTWLVASPKCDNATAAHDFVKYFTADEEAMESYANTYGDFVNNKTAMDAVASGDYKNPALGDQNQFTVLKDAADGITLSSTMTKYDQQIKDQFNTAVTDNLGTDADTVMSAFKDNVKANVTDVTVE